MDEWPFSDPENLATMTVRQITHGGEPILLVSHDANDGMWQFLTGGTVTMADAMIVALREVYDKAGKASGTPIVVSSSHEVVHCQDGSGTPRIGTSRIALKSADRLAIYWQSLDSHRILLGPTAAGAFPTILAIDHWSHRRVDLFRLFSRLVLVVGFSGIAWGLCAVRFNRHISIGGFATELNGLSSLLEPLRMRNFSNSALTFTFGAMATLALSMSSASIADTVTYDFDVTGDDGATLDGWTDVLGESFPGSVIFSNNGNNDGGRGTGGGGNGAGNQDSAHPNHIMRSPMFYLTATSSIDFQLAGGDQGGTPTNESQITAGTSDEFGFQGLALRRVSDGEYLLFDTRDGNGNGYQAQTAFDAAALAPIFATNMNEAFTLDWVDTYSGSWGFGMIDDVVLNDVSFQAAPVPEPAGVATWSLIGLGLAGVARRRRRR